MMRGARNLLWAVPLLLLLSWPLYGDALRFFLAPPPLPEVEEAEVAAQPFVMKEVRLYQDVAEARQWRIDTPTLRTGDDPDELLLAAVDAVLFREEVEHLHITAQRGLYDSSGEILYLEEDVRVREADGFELTTPALEYHEREGRISSRAGVEVLVNDLWVQGRELDYDLESGRYELTGDVRFVTP